MPQNDIVTKSHYQHIFSQRMGYCAILKIGIPSIPHVPIFVPACFFLKIVVPCLYICFD